MTKYAGNINPLSEQKYDASQILVSNKELTTCDNSLHKLRAPRT